MTAVTVREFSYNPSAMFARVERGETIEVTRHGTVIALITAPPEGQSRYEELVARGLVRPAESGLTTRDLDQFTRVKVIADVDPLSVLLESRETER